MSRYKVGSKRYKVCSNNNVTNVTILFIKLYYKISRLYLDELVVQLFRHTNEECPIFFNENRD